MTTSALEAALPDPTRPTEGLLEGQKLVLESIVQGHPIREVLAALCRLVESQAERTVRAAIMLVDPTGRRLGSSVAPSLPEAYHRAAEGLEIQDGAPTCPTAAFRREVVVTRDLETDPGWEGLRQLPLALGLRAVWSMPILSARGTVLGTFGTYFPEPRAPTASERELVEVLARTAALAIERDRADRELRANAERHRIMAELADRTQPLADPEAVLRATARLLIDHLAVDRCSYAEVDGDRLRVITGEPCDEGPPSDRMEMGSFGEGFARVLRAGRAFVSSSIDDDPRIEPTVREAFRSAGMGAIVVVPLLEAGQLVAAMGIRQRRPRSWTPAEVELVELVASRCREALGRIRATRTLQESEARYRAIVETTPECVKVVAADGTLLQINQAGLEMLECDEEQALGRSVFDLVAPEHRAAFRSLHDRVCRGERGTLEFDVIGLHGTRRSMESTAVPLPTADGFTLLAITRDVTARKLQDRALADSRARLDFAVRASGVGFWFCALPFADLDWDERVKEHFWFPPDARVTIDTFYERIHPDDREPTREAIDRSIGERSTCVIDYRTVNPADGRIKWIRALGGASYAPDGEPTRFDGVTLDVTDRKLEERRQVRVLEEVAEAALAIHASGSLDNVLHVFTDRARRILHASEAVTRLAPTESQLGLEVRATADGGPGRTDQRREVALVGRAGSTLGTIELALDPDGAFAEGSEAILVQLAQIAAVAIDNARLYGQLLDQDHRKNEFLATLAHELRNPLAPIRTGLRILGIAGSSEQAAATREMMERQVAHMVRMVDDLLDLSRITRGKVTLKPERVDFRAVLDAALETSRPAIESGGHELAIRMPREALPLEVDPTRLAQVFANLLNNSAKYTPAGGRIQVAADREGAELVVHVTDSGVGMPVDMLPRVFEMFTQVGRSIDRSQGGLGVGLTLVRRLVEMHGGSVEAHSDGPGTGSTFTVRLPLARREQDRADRRSSTASTGVARSRILVVDDNVDAAATLATMLKFEGHEIALAHTGPEAIEVAGPFQPDVVLLDIGLPGMNGYEVARRLAQPEGPVLIAITGWGGEEDRRQAHAAGFHHHLVKPVDPDELSTLLADVRPA